VRLGAAVRPQTATQSIVLTWAGHAIDVALSRVVPVTIHSCSKLLSCILGLLETRVHQKICSHRQSRAFLAGTTVLPERLAAKVSLVSHSTLSKPEHQRTRET
jgi:hypothetical protein